MNFEVCFTSDCSEYAVTVI